MLTHVFLMLFLAAVPFWEAKPADSWTVEEARALLTDSPWAQKADTGRNRDELPAPVYLASADPVILAEDRLRASRRSHGEDPAWTEYREYLVENSGKYIVLAILVIKPEALLDNSESRRMEEESVLRSGKRKYRVTGHFPPSRTDPFVRLVFPREVFDTDKSLRFELYVPGTGRPYRQAEFRLKDMLYRGKRSF